ncbi:MAG: DUF6385 domain-containing protein [Acetanaerobacterium sp.]
MIQINTTGTCETTFVSSRCPNQNLCDAKYMAITSHQPSGTQSAGLPRLAGEPILERATLYIYLRGTGMPLPFARQNGEVRLLLFENSANFAPCEVTWRSRPPVDERPIAQMVIPAGTGPRYLCWDITPTAVKWTDERQIGGLTLCAAPHAITRSVLDSSCGEYLPRLLLQYRTLPPAPCPCKDERFEERYFTLHGDAPMLFSPTIDTSLSSCNTFFLQNLGAGSVEAHLQISPDDREFIDDPQIIPLQSGSVEALNAYRFARYTRVAVKNESATAPTDLKIWFQSQLVC